MKRAKRGNGEAYKPVAIKTGIVGSTTLTCLVE